MCIPLKRRENTQNRVCVCVGGIILVIERSWVNDRLNALRVYQSIVSPVMAILQDHLLVPSRTICSACSRLSMCVSGSTENVVLKRRQCPRHRIVLRQSLSRLPILHLSSSSLLSLSRYAVDVHSCSLERDWHEGDISPLSRPHGSSRRLGRCLTEGRRIVARRGDRR